MPPIVGILSAFLFDLILYVQEQTKMIPLGNLFKRENWPPGKAA